MPYSEDEEERYKRITELNARRALILARSKALLEKLFIFKNRLL